MEYTIRTRLFLILTAILFTAYSLSSLGTMSGIGVAIEKGSIWGLLAIATSWMFYLPVLWFIYFIYTGKNFWEAFFTMLNTEPKRFYKTLYGIGLVHFVSVCLMILGWE